MSSRVKGARSTRGLLSADGRHAQFCAIVTSRTHHYAFVIGHASDVSLAECAAGSTGAICCWSPG